MSSALRSLRWLVCLLASLAARAGAESPSYRIDAAVTASPARVAGTVHLTFVNPTAAPLQEAVLLLQPNRFASVEADAAVDDFNRPYVYPEQEFDPGRIDVRVWEGDAEGGADSVLAQETVVAPHLCAGCAVRVRLPSPLAPAERCRLTLRFETVVPHRFGSFGEYDGQLTLVGGWHPLLADLEPDGWHLDAPPAPARFDAALSVPGNLTAVLNGTEGQGGRLELHAEQARYLTLIAGSGFERHQRDVGSTQIVLLSRSEALTSRISFDPDPPELILDALADALQQAPAPLTAAPSSLLVVEAPLRLSLIAPSQGLLVISDRSMKVNELLRPFHERQLAQALYAEWVRRSRPRGDGRDGIWVTEGVAHSLADRYLAQRPPTRSVHDWIELFNLFAVVDRFETAPKVPFVDAFFERWPVVDPLHEQVTTFNNDLPPGHVIVDKQRAELGEDEFQRLTDAYVSGDEDWRQQLQSQCGARCGPLLEQWLQPYPELNYAVADEHLNEPAGAGFRQTVSVRRDSDRPIEEPVDISIRSIGGELVRVRWNGPGAVGEVVAETQQRAWRAVIDPDRRLIETTRVDNAQPKELQLVLDSAEVEISSTEFGFAALAVGRQRYDYTKDIAIAGIYTNRGVGTAIGPRLHFGPPNDANTYRHNLFGFYSVQALDSSFNEDNQPTVRTSGHSNGLGLRYDYSDVYAYDNPTDSLRARLFGDWYDGAVGSSYDYADWGGSFTFTKALWTPRTVLAGEVTNGFSQPIGGSRVPLQGQFSLGGSRSIRGVGAEEEIARNIFLVRAEIRRSVYPEVDLNFMDLAVLRRAQLRLFVDSGQVSDSAGAIYDPSGYAVGVGTGFGFTYEFLGFFPAMAYLEIATRVDRSDKLGDVQVLFGSRQAF